MYLNHIYTSNRIYDDIIHAARLCQYFCYVMYDTVSRGPPSTRRHGIPHPLVVVVVAVLTSADNSNSSSSSTIYSSCSSCSCKNSSRGSGRTRSTYTSTGNSP